MNTEDVPQLLKQVQQKNFENMFLNKLKHNKQCWLSVLFQCCFSVVFQKYNKYNYNEAGLSYKFTMARTEFSQQQVNDV